LEAVLSGVINPSASQLRRVDLATLRYSAAFEMDMYSLIISYSQSFDTGIISRIGKKNYYLALDEINTF
jgi:hypothetical protein